MKTLKKLVLFMDGLLTLAGFIFISVGIYKIYSPLGFITAGVFLAFSDNFQIDSFKRKGVG